MRKIQRVKKDKHKGELWKKRRTRHFWTFWSEQV